ncbi:Hydroxyacylglutathione hydrolase GloC [bacterium HR10]|nr:Hydroxyacylglutathione hydrolase GloC [bacterium HR10]
MSTCEDRGVILETQPVGPFWMNTYVVGCARTREAVIIDPGYEPDVILGFLSRHRLVPKYILCTHGHVDHVGAVAEVKAATGAPICLHPEDLFLYERMVEWGALFGMRVRPGPTPDHWLSDGEELRVGDHRITALHTPGHTPGGMSFLLGDILFVGDTLFAGSVGRTDLPGGSWSMLLRSITEKLLPLGDHVRVYSGHGPATTLGRERRTNPFLQGGGRP